MRPEVSWKRTRGGRAWHIFLAGQETPVCGVVSGAWMKPTDRVGIGRLPVHQKCWKAMPYKPRLNAVMSTEEIERELPA